VNTSVAVRPVSHLWQVGLIAGVYFVAARMSLGLAIPPGYATPVWPPSGIALAATLLLGGRIWPGVWIGAALVNLTVEGSLITAALVATGNTLEALVGGALIRRYVGIPRHFERSEDVVKFIVLCALSPAIAATVALIPLGFGHGLSWREILSNWWTWWEGDVAGIIVITPLILSWSVRDAVAWPPQKKLELTYFGLLLLVSAAAILVVDSRYFAPFSLTFVSLPFIIWAAFRFGQREVATTTAVVCSVAIWYTVAHPDLLGSGSVNEWLLMLLTFICMVVVTGLTLVTVVGERGRTIDRLHKAYDELELRVRRHRPEEIDRRPLQEIEEPTRPEKLSPERSALSPERFRGALRVLIVEDQVADAELMVRELGRAGYRLDWQRVETKSDYAAAVESRPDVVLADYSVPGFNALQALDFLRARSADVPLIVVTGSLRDEAAADCIKRGAADYLLKDRLARLPEAVAQALEQRRLRDERELAEDKIKRLNRVYAMLSGINALIVRVRDRSCLFDEACRIAVEDGQFGTAWIGTFEPATREVTPVAWAGLGAEDIALATSKATTRSDVREGQGALGRAIREKRPAFSNDLAAERMGGGKRRQAVMNRGYRSLIVLPLMAEGAVVATLGLCAKEPHFFDEEELKLLNQLAGDISLALEHIGKEEKLAYLAHYDVLTGLPNRALFHERLSYQLHIAEQKKTKVTLFLGDVKRFRLINESLGRHAGDALLRELAARLKNIWPDPHNVARIAADCFTGVLADAGDEADIVHLLEKSIKEGLSPPFKINEKELTVSMTVGIAVFPADGSDADTLFKNAEAALKKAKKSGEHFLFYQREMNARVAETLLLENKMRRALDQQQFVLHYQPKIELATESISGLEALIRWNDPEAGLVPPMQFIPLLEETGMILEAGRWAILEALKEYEGWSKQGLMPPRIAVNVSPIQLRQKGFVDVVRDALRASGTEPPGLDLEITESLIMEDIEGNIEKLRAIRDLGVNIAIDDFGTGYSSLGYLAKLPVNALKIDRSFIITMVKDRDSMSIVSTIISLAHTLTLKVVAEGVDSEEQSRLLKQLKCDEIQGYLFSKPLPAAQVKAKFLGAEI
jgi:diguanylate cyclase (GGDEF)-like protein